MKPSQFRKPLAGIDSLTLYNAIDNACKRGRPVSLGSCSLGEVSVQTTAVYSQSHVDPGAFIAYGTLTVAETVVTVWWARSHYDVLQVNFDRWYTLACTEAFKRHQKNQIGLYCVDYVDLKRPSMQAALTMAENNGHVTLTPPHSTPPVAVTRRALAHYRRN